MENKMENFRCNKCNKLLFRSPNIGDASIFIRCPRCNQDHWIGRKKNDN